MLFGEFFIQDEINYSLQQVREDASLLDQLMDGLSPDHVLQLKNWLTSTSIKVGQAYPRAMTDIPCIFIVVDNDSEVVEENVLGAAWEERIEDGVYTMNNEVPFRARYTAIVLTENASTCSYLSNLVKWALIRARNRLQFRGLEQQRLSMSPLEPSDKYLPTFAWTRSVILEGVHRDIYTIPYDTPTLTSLEITGPSYGEEENFHG